jgi:hypothetical protein
MVRTTAHMIDAMVNLAIPAKDSRAAVDRRPGRRRGRRHSPDTAVPDGRRQRPVLRLAAPPASRTAPTYARTARGRPVITATSSGHGWTRNCHGLPIPGDTTSDKFALLGRRSSITERPHRLCSELPARVNGRPPGPGPAPRRRVASKLSRSTETLPPPGAQRQPPAARP